MENRKGTKGAPAGEREAVEVVGWRHSATGSVTEDAVRASTWISECVSPLMTVAQHERILAAWQRTQAAGVPEGLLELLREMVDLHERRGTVLTVHMEQICAMLAAPAQPAAQGEFGDAYQGAREDLAIWKRRALEAEAKVRHQDRIIGCLGEELNAINGPAFMGEPVLPAAQAQSEKVAHSAQWPTTPGLSARPSEVQRLREALTVALEALESTEGNINPERGFADELEEEVSIAANTVRAALAASTGQEVE